MGGKSAGKVYDFLMSIHYGLCHGPIDRLNKVWIKDKSALCGEYTTREDIPVRQPELFGGDEGEGGVVGEIEFYPGSDDQVSSEALASRAGRTAANMPGYRGIASLFFRGFGAEGFRWTSNNPYLPGVKASVSRFPVSLGEANSRIYPVQEVVEQPAEDESGNPIFGGGTDFLPESSQDGFVGNNYPADFNRNAALPVPRDNNDWQLGSASTRPVFEWTSTQSGTDIEDGVVTANLALNFMRDFRLSDLGITGAMVDDGEVEVEIVWRQGGTTSNTSLSLTRYTDSDIDSEPWSNTNDVQSWQMSSSAESETTSIATLPSGTRAFRIQVTRFDGYFALDSIIIRWKEPSLVFCDPDNEGLRLLPNANPAHIIHETMTNPEWGKGEDPTRIDTASFTAAAQTFYDEFFGLAFTWVRQGSVEDFIQQVLDHTRSMLFIHPRTGLWTLRPLRGDYDAPTVLAGRRLDPSNCVARKRKRRAWGETVNEVIVKYTDPQSEEEATVNAHNLANIAIQGGVIPETRPYPGIRDRWLAERVAEREVIEAGHPLYTAEIEAGREFWDVVPGDVLAYSWPEDGIADMIVRVMNVDYGSATDRVVKMSVAEDIFALDETAYGPVQTSEWASQRAVPEPLDAQMALAGPLPLLVRSGFDISEVDTNYPATGVMLLGTDEDNLAIDIEVNMPVVRNDGSTANEAVSVVDPVRTLLLQDPLAEEASSTLPGSFIATLALGSAEQGDLLVVGDGEANHEIVMLGAYDSGTDEWTVWRGIYDTVPAPWATGTRVWVLPEFGGQSDPEERAGGESMTYRLLPRMSEGRLPQAEATPLSYTVTERPHLPFRPANTQIDGNGFALANYTSSPPTYPIPVTWSNRNRTVEDQVAMRWTEANVTPESGQTTVIRVFDDQDVLAGEITGLTGTSYGMQSADFFSVGHGYLEFVSERDGLRSRPGARRWFDLRQSGFGNNYGVSYG